MLVPPHYHIRPATALSVSYIVDVSASSPLHLAFYRQLRLRPAAHRTVYQKIIARHLWGPAEPHKGTEPPFAVRFLLIIPLVLYRNEKYQADAKDAGKQATWVPSFRRP